MLTHKGTQTIKTERLTLRRFEVNDAEAMYNNWAKDERVCKFLTWDPHESAQATAELLRIWCADYEKKDFYQWAIVHGETLIGSISVVCISNQHEYAELGYCIGYDFWRQGFMPEAAKAVIDFLFSEVNFNRIEICHAVKNPASGAVAKKCGLTFEGTKKEKFKARNGEFLDMSYYGLTKNDWRKSL